MKKFYMTLLTVALAAASIAQVPDKMSYQAVIRDSEGNLVTEQEIGMRISIIQGTVFGASVYIETQSPLTNENGLVTIVIGDGVVVHGTFSGIEWANSPYFIKTETDPSGGTTYTITGTSQLLTVPYALHAKTAETISEPIVESDPVFEASPAAGIETADIANWDEAHSWGDHAEEDYLTEETDPVFAAWDRSAGIEITESQVTDLQEYYLASNPDGFITAYIVTEQDVTAHESALSISESQISDLQSYLTSITGQSIGNLADVDLTGIETGKVLKYDAVEEKWVVADLPGLTEETDPVFEASPAAVIENTDIERWNASYIIGDNIDVASVSISGQTVIGSNGILTGPAINHYHHASYITGNIDAHLLGGSPPDHFLSVENFFTPDISSTSYQMQIIHPNILFKGRIYDGSNLPVNGNITITANIYDSPAGGEFLWSESQEVNLDRGSFAMELGSENPFGNLFEIYYPLYLELVIGAEAFAERVKLIRVSNAFESEVAQRLAGTTGMGSGSGLDADLLDGFDSSHFLTAEFEEEDPVFNSTFNINSPQDGDLLKFDEASQTWIEFTPDYAAGTHAHAIATDEADGFMSAADKEKLDGLGGSLSIGDSYQGGIIFWLDASGEHGLIAASEDQSTGIQWYNGAYTWTTAFASAVGAGYGNTRMIVYQQGAGAYAAQLCRDLSLGGYNDWYLPSKYELNLMYQNIGQGNLLGLGNVGNFASAYYWSSTEVINNYAWNQLFSNGNQNVYDKNTTFRVRAVRAF